MRHHHLVVLLAYHSIVHSSSIGLIIVVMLHQSLVVVQVLVGLGVLVHAVAVVVIAACIRRSVGVGHVQA